jgi:undecaprenyl diphosphate synthase
MNILPKHVAIIMDGNGRWAQSQGKPRILGHRQGTKATRETVRICTELGIQHLTLYVFSSENWSRPPKEVSFLMSLLADMIDSEVKDMMKKNVKLKVLGELDRLPNRARKKLVSGIEKTSTNTGLQLNLAISYGGRQEIVHSCKSICEKVQKGLVSWSDISEEMISQNLYLPEVPDPELIIRTGGDSRISNYLIWQAAYSELYITQVLWPDFGDDEFNQALEYYKGKQRRFGGVIDTDE